MLHQNCCAIIARLSNYFISFWRNENPKYSMVIHNWDSIFNRMWYFSHKNLLPYRAGKCKTVLKYAYFHDHK